MFSFLRHKSLDSILSSFEKVASDLTTHVEKKAEEKFSLLEEKSFIEDLITDTDKEIDRADRVLAKVKEFVF